MTFIFQKQKNERAKSKRSRKTLDKIVEEDGTKNEEKNTMKKCKLFH